MDNRRLVLLAALAGIGFLLWQAWQHDYPGPPPGRKAATEHLAAPGNAKHGKSPASPAPPDNATAQSGRSPSEQNAQSPTKPPGGQNARHETPKATTASGKTITVTTDQFVAKISIHGGNLVRVKLLKYAVSKDHPHEKLDFLDNKRPYFFVAQSGLSTAADSGPTQKSVFEAEKKHYSLSNGTDTLRVPLKWQGPDGRRFVKTYIFHRDSYQVELKQRVENSAAAGPWKIAPYIQLWRTPNTPTENPRFLHAFLGAAMYEQQGDKDDYKYEKLGFDDLDNDSLDKIQTGGWMAMDQHYFLAAIIPPSDAKVRYYAKPRALPGSGDKAYLAGFVGQRHEVAPGSKKVFHGKLFVGPKLQDELPKVAPGLGLTVDYSFFTIIARPVFWVLNKIHSVVGNWGWAIVLVTLLIRAAFYKLTEAQYRSMARMKKFGPRMKQIKERFSDDREKMQKAMMDLYKKEGFNPLGGCWPMIIQFPVFIALYWVLRNSVELRQAPWILWIHDLSTPDPYYILPILYGISMFAQQKLSGNSMAMDEMQRKMMMLMPLGLAIFFTFFPSGLVLYWLVSNLVGIAQQWVITRRIEGAPAKR